MQATDRLNKSSMSTLTGTAFVLTALVVGAFGGYSLRGANQPNRPAAITVTQTHASPAVPSTRWLKETD